MQILGRVPNARRPPANLPSLKSEHSGSDAAVSLVPSGGPGWGKQDTPTSTASSTSPATLTAAPASAAANGATNNSVTVVVAGAPPACPGPPPPPKQTPPQTVAAPPATAGADKSWSAVMAGADLPGHPPPYHSAQFQHEFPSLSADGAAVAGGVAGGGVAGHRLPAGPDAQYGPGPSLRPQTEGSWMQGKKAI